MISSHSGASRAVNITVAAVVSSTIVDIAVLYSFIHDSGKGTEEITTAISTFAAAPNIGMTQQINGDILRSSISLAKFLLCKRKIAINARTVINDASTLG